MKVIRQGTLPEEKLHQAECCYCHTVVEFSESEAHKGNNYNSGAYLMVRCPTCEKDIRLDV